MLGGYDQLLGEAATVSIVEVRAAGSGGRDIASVRAGPRWQRSVRPYLGIHLPDRERQAVLLPCLLRLRRGARRRRADRVGHSLPARDEAWGLYAQAHARRQTSPRGRVPPPAPYATALVQPGHRNARIPRGREPELPAASLALRTTRTSQPRSSPNG